MRATLAVRRDAAETSSASASLAQALGAGKWGRFVRRNICTLRKPVYELVVVTRAAALRAEAEAELGGVVDEDAFSRFSRDHPALSKAFSQDHLFLG